MTPRPSFNWVRRGWPAAIIDLVFAVLCLLGAYRLRFDGVDFERFLGSTLPVFPIILFAQGVVLAALGVYRIRGQRLWPLKISAGAIGGVAAGFAIIAVTVGLVGQSRQATAVYALAFALTSLAWRSAVGLHARFIDLREERGSDVLEERGVHHRTISGGLLLAWRYRHLFRNLVVKDLKLKYRGSVLGFAWSLLNPLVMIVVYTFAFRYVMRIQTERYAFFVLLGLLAWNFFAGAVMGSTGAIAEGGSLIKSVLFPRVILPIAGVAFNAVQYLLTVVVFLPLMLTWYRIPLGPQMLVFPIFLALQMVFICGLALILATATAWLRDIRHLVEVAMNVAFWATPIIYEMSSVPEEFRFAMLLSPMAAFVRAYQDIFYYQTMPDVSIWLVAVAYAVGAFTCGVSVFVSYEGGFAEQV